MIPGVAGSNPVFHPNFHHGGLPWPCPDSWPLGRWFRREAGKRLSCDARLRYYFDVGPLAQLVEQLTLNQ